MVGRVTFISKTTPKLTLNCWLGGEGSKVTAGYGGWTIVNRPRRTGVTHWNGRQPYEMSIAIVIDGFSDRDAIEAECFTLEQMALPWGKQPPVIEIVSNSVPHTDLDWVITNIEWGNSIRGQFNGKRIRQEATVNLLRYNPADKLQLSAAQNSRNKKKSPAFRIR